ncbi:hypothetical protein F4820DRAFT_41118 [Hypoxylon rubiginosum]|uniref:Uncharacterized protein n=1 Tax=Hypoxylon rubiginosum TaxID=110542 RepID=A0ACB9YRR5_9PEZI|nr:hypothetical protein F4820DRAFT_41118 [Hypoxylon rubiginosum]
MEWATDERFSTYKQYKEDTEAIAGWLAYNSRRCGYQIDGPLPPGPANAPSSRLKGKARKQARSAGAKPATAQTVLRPQYAINVSDFNRMAKAIADFKPKLAIPKALDNLFSRAIDARRQFTEWYQRSSHGEEGSNKRHAHFTGVLASAWEILRPFEPARTSHVKKRPADAPKPEPVATLANRFANLEVEQSCDVGVDTETSTSTGQEDDYKLTDVAPVTIVKSEEDLEEDFFFAIFAFMQELDEVRAYIRHTWLGYKKGIMELIVASLLTNTAIQLVRRAEHELDLMIQRPKKYPASRYPVWHFPDIFIYATHEEDLAKEGRDLDSFLTPSARYHIMGCSHADLCLSETFSALKHCLYEFKARRGQSLLAGNVPHHEKAPETFVRIKDMLPCFQGISRTMAEAFASDEVTSGIGLMFDSQTIPIWVAFAVQALLDIQDELKAVPRKATQEVQQHTRNKLASFRSMDFNQEPFSQADRGTQWLAATLGAYELDVLGDNFRKKLISFDIRDLSGRTVPFSHNMDAVRGLPGTHEFMYEPDYFLRINPVKCGMLKYGLYLQPHNYAVQFEAGWRGVTGMVHLYIACRSIFPDDPVWPDMEYFLSHQDLDNLFFGGLPSSMEEARKKTLLAAGVTAVNFARNRRSTVPNLNMDKGRWVSNPCLLDDVFSNWMCGGKVMTDDMILNLIKVISDPKSAASKAKPAGISSKSTSRSDDTRAEAGLRKITILTELASHVISETHDLYFDWLSFIETCQKIWSQIYSALDKQNGMQPERSPHVSVIDMLDEAQKCQWMSEVDKVDTNSFVREHATGLVQSWEIIQKVSRHKIPLENIPTDKKIWTGDKELFHVVSKAKGESTYPNLSMSSLQKVYKNWPKEDFNSSLTVGTNCADWPGMKNGD